MPVNATLAIELRLGMCDEPRFAHSALEKVILAFWLLSWLIPIAAIRICWTWKHCGPVPMDKIRVRTSLPILAQVLAIRATRSALWDAHSWLMVSRIFSIHLNLKAHRIRNSC